MPTINHYQPLSTTINHYIPGSPFPIIFPSFYHRPHEDQPLSWKYIQYQIAVIHFPLVMTNSLLLKMAIEIVPVKKCDFPWLFVCLPDGTSQPHLIKSY